MSGVTIYQNDVQGAGFETYKVVLPDGQEFVNQYKNRPMNLDMLRPYVGGVVALHVYCNGEFMFAEDSAILVTIVDGEFGHYPRFEYGDE